jgi:hypothetical protein
VKLVSGTLKALKGAGRLRDIDPTVGALGVLGMIVWLPRWVQPRGRMTCQQVAEQIATLALNGLLLPTGPHAGVARRR